MLKKSFRLPTTGFKVSKVFSSKTFVLKIAENSKENSRFGFVVSKRIDKRAVIRNKIKRTLRTCIEKNLGAIRPGFDFLFILKTKDKEICQDFENVLRKENFLI